MKVLYDFYADWCPPCKVMIPVIDELEKTYKVVKINVDKDLDKTAEYNVMSIPTYIVEEDGKVVEQFIGVQDKEVLEKAMRV